LISLRTAVIRSVVCGALLGIVGANAQTLSPQEAQALYSARASSANVDRGDLAAQPGYQSPRIGGNGEANGLAQPNAQPGIEPSMAARPLARAIQRNEPNDFQKFVLEATGKLLPLYGADFFATDSAWPIQGAPVPNDYPLGPGDELLIRGWGSVDIDLRAVVDRNGLISIPKVGTVSVAGVRAAEAEAVIRNEISKYFRGFNLNVTLGQLRTITVYMVGQAKRPGTYMVSSLSTLVTALSDTGGPNQHGSLRHVQVKRAGKQIAELDFYAFLGKGDKSGDVKLIDGDVIVIPPAAGYVALTGKVKSPAVYELRGSDDTLQNLLEVAGGLPVLADPRRAFLEHIDPSKNLSRSVEEIALDGAGLSRQLKNGDLVSVLSANAEFANAVTLRGTVSQAVRAPYSNGMKVTDLIPSKDFLVTKAVVRRQNRALIFQGRQDDQNINEQFPREQAELRRSQRNSQNGPAVGQGAGLVRQQNDGADDSSPPLDPVKNLDNRTLAESVGNLYDEINWDYAVVERLNRADLSVTLVPFNLGKAMADPNGSDNVPLQAGDTVTVFSVDDVRVPIAKRRVFVRVEGEVQRPGVYQISAGESLVGVLQKAGGLTNDAFLFGAEFYRESARKSQQENLEKFVNRLEQQMLQGSRRALSSRTANDPTAAQAAQAEAAIEAESRNRFIQKLRELKATGRIALNMSPEDKSFAQLPDFRLENGDRLVVPNRPDFVQIFGAVNTESAMFWQPDKTVSDYLEQSGVSATADEDAVFVLRASGMALSNSGRWLSSVKGQSVLPGDIIVVPEKVDVETAWNAFIRGTKDISQIFANFGLAAAAIHTLNKD